jgi:hypothetical protein
MKSKRSELVATIPSAKASVSDFVHAFRAHDGALRAMQFINVYEFTTRKGGVVSQGENLLGWSIE